MAYVVGMAGLAEAALTMGIAILAVWAFAIALAAIGILFRVLRPRSSGWIAIAMGAAAIGITLLSALLAPTLLCIIPLPAAVVAIVMGIRAFDGPIRLSSDRKPPWAADALAAFFIAVIVGLLIGFAAWNEVNRL